MTDRMEPKHKLTVKVGDALRTIQGYTLEEYLEARTELLSELAGDAEAVAMARAAGNAAPLIAAAAPAVASAPPGALADNPWPAAPPAFAAAAAAAPNCAHGPRTGRSGTGARDRGRHGSVTHRRVHPISVRLSSLTVTLLNGMLIPHEVTR